MRAEAAGDRVALHRYETSPGGDESGTMDCFRFEVDGKLFEHQDEIQPVQPQTKSGNTIY